MGSSPISGDADRERGLRQALPHVAGNVAANVNAFGATRGEARHCSVCLRRSASRVARLVGVAVSGHDLAAREDGESVLDSSVPISLGRTPRPPGQQARWFLVDEGLKCEREGAREKNSRNACGIWMATL